MKITRLNDIVKIIAYKIDLLTTDEVRMNIIYDNFTTDIISEEDTDWDDNIKILESLYGFNLEWEKSVLQPAFKTCETVVYTRILCKQT